MMLILCKRVYNQTITIFSNLKQTTKVDNNQLLMKLTQLIGYERDAGFKIASKKLY
jgi:S-adenosylmethionine synthetase